jgi:hypothetical protein
MLGESADDESSPPTLGGREGLGGPGKDRLGAHIPIASGLGKRGKVAQQAVLVLELDAHGAVHRAIAGEGVV